MEIGYELLVFCTHFSKYIDRRKKSHIVYGSKEALSLLNESPEALIQSGRMDYFLTTVGNKKNPSPELLYREFKTESHTLVDEKTYGRLYQNLCEKIREMKKKKPWPIRYKVSANGPL